MGETITVLSPGSVANVGCGFDMMGFALNGMGDRFTLGKNPSGKLRIQSISGFSNQISLDPEKNTAGVALLSMCKFLGIDPGFSIDIEKMSPVGSGLGSSASSTTAAVFALNEFLGCPIKEKKDLMPFALQGESLASGCFHADNVAPSLLGGFLVISSLKPLRLISIPIPADLEVILIHPHLEILTKMARGLVPQTVPLTKVTQQMGYLATFIMGMVNSDQNLIRESIEDLLAEPYRAHLIPGYYEVKKKALEMGAVGCSISGSGPTLFALVDKNIDRGKILLAMKQEFKKFGVESDTYLPGFNFTGVVAV
jgi:homoserine kinase